MGTVVFMNVFVFDFYSRVFLLPLFSPIVDSVSQESQQGTMSQQLFCLLSEKADWFPSLPGPQSQFAGWYLYCALLYPLQKASPTNFHKKPQLLYFSFPFDLLDDSSV